MSSTRPVLSSALVQRLVLEHRRTLAAALAAIAVLTGLASVRTSQHGVAVMAAARDIPSAQRITASDLRRVTVPDDAVPRSALTRRDQAVGRRLAGPVRRGELLTDRRILGPGALDGHAPGTVLTTLRVGDADGLSSVRVGDVVDVVAVNPEERGPARVVARGLEVLATRRASAEDGALVDVAAEEADSLKLAAAGLRSRLTVLISTRAGRDR